MSDETSATPEATEAPATSNAAIAVPVDDDALAAASGGQSCNSTELVYASTFVPFDSSF